MHLDSAMDGATPGDVRRSIITALLIACAFVAGCDMCVVSIQVHLERCQEGDQASCDWIDDNVVGAYCKS